jgi:hypothetical protein
MSDLFTVDHVAQLQEIQKARLRRNQPGIGPMVEELIRRLTDGGVAGNTKGIRVAQAKRYWDLGVGREFCFASFSDYLGLIPEVPEPLNCVDAAFPILLLVEPRLGLKELCDLAGVGFDGNNRTFVAYDRHHYEFSVPTWIRVQDGWHYRNRAVRDCRKSFGQGEVGLTALQGVCLYVQHPELWVDLNGSESHALDLAGSVLRDLRDSAAYLSMQVGQPKLNGSFDDDASSEYGSASRREC